jgi:non-specific serine/threonine protein kinase/serine/threonine-protein kinase
MTPEEWQRVRPILESALELNPASRPAFLDGACADSLLRREVESLLNSQEQAGTDALNPGSVLSFDPEEEARFRLVPGKRIGAYEILGEIALGGMGAVYRAIRADGQYKQQVALKIVRADFGAGFTAARFRNERQILANLDHPNIAKILDGGATADGLPYFVMELIDGLPITEYCDKQKLSIDTRLKLFRTVCSAVHYAHQHLVVHRDLKPSNILINSEGVPKLLDFGIAKMLDPNLLPENATLTVEGQWLMTPEYASPEQFRGVAITTATDVYSLGLVLYELLAGRRAYRFASRVPHEIARAVLEIDPEKPSAILNNEATVEEKPEKPLPAPELVSGLRADSAEKLNRRISGDLDNIVLKAIRKEPAARYASADQLSEDIRRHLDGLPVWARKNTIAYRCRKYVIRHKVGVAAAALVFLSLLTGMLFTLREARIAHANQLRAEQRFNDVRRLANSLMFEVHDSIKDLAGATPARKLLVTKALEYLDSLSQEAAGDVSLQRELAAAYEKVGDVQGNPFSANLGDTAGALASYRKALAIRESIAANDRNSDENQRALSDDYEWVGVGLEASGDSRSALEYFRKDFVIKEQLARTTPSVKSQERLAGAHFLMAQCYSALQDANSALENYRKSAAIREAIAADSPIVQSRLAGTYGYMAGILDFQGDTNQALVLQRKALDIMKKLSDANPDNATHREFLDEAYYWVGFYLEKQGDFAQALLNYRRALAGFQELASADPREVRTKLNVGRCEKSIGTALVSEGQVAQGLESIGKGLAVFEELPSPDNVEYIADAYGAIGLAYSRLAAQSGMPAPSRIANWRHARLAYQKSLDGWLVAKNRGVLTVFDASESGRISGELAKCDAALTKLAAPAHKKGTGSS